MAQIHALTPEGRLPSQAVAHVEEIVPYRAESVASSDDTLAAITDEAGRSTWLAANATDGGPTAHAVKHIREAGGRSDHATDGDYLVTFTDRDGKATDLTVRASDGQFADFVIDRIAARLGGAGTNPHDRWVHPSGDLVPVNVDMSAWSAWGSSGIARLAADLAAVGQDIGAPYFDGGKGGERSWHTVARLGSDPALLTFPADTIPATTDPVDVTASNMPPIYAMKPFTGVINGVAGRLTSSDETVTFTRTTAGDAVPVDPDTPFIPDDGPQYRANPAVIQLGKNDITLEPNSGPGVIEATHTAFDWFAPVTKRVLVLGHHTNVGWTSGGVGTQRLYTVNAECARRYGDQYLDIQDWLMSPEVWTDTGITPTQADLDAQADRGLPDSLSPDGIHLIPAVNTLIAGKIRDRFAALGWY